MDSDKTSSDNEESALIQGTEFHFSRQFDASFFKIFIQRIQL